MQPVQPLPLSPPTVGAYAPGAGSLGDAPPPGALSPFERLLDEARVRDVVAQQAVEQFARGGDPGRIHEVMIAASKAEIALRTVASVRTKLLDAYRDLQHVIA